MSKDEERDSAKDAMAKLDIQLGGLLGTLGDTLTQAIQRLEDAGEAKLQSSHEINTSRGPLRAEAGVHVRFAAQEGSSGSQNRPPSNNEEGLAPREMRTKEASSRVKSDLKSEGGFASIDRRPDIVSYSSQGHWFVCADLPGVIRNDVSVIIGRERRPYTLSIQTTGARKYTAEQLLPETIEPESLSYEIRNGVLEVCIKLGD